MDPIPLHEPVVGDPELENIREVLDSGYMTQGPRAEQFEEAVARRVDADYGITATSATTGLELGLEATGVGQGDEVIVPDFTYPATANVVERLGADPVLVDVDRETYNVDPAAIEAAVTETTEAIMPVSLTGNPLDPDPINEIADTLDLDVIEDAAPSFGATYDGTPVGSQFDVSVFSFHPRKVVGIGEGGVVTLDDGDLANEIRTRKNFGLDHHHEGENFVRANATNYRLSDVLAAIGVAQLDRVEDLVSKRREIAHVYDDLLEPVEGVDAPAERAEAYHIYQSYSVYIEAGDDDTRDAVMETFKEHDIGCSVCSYALHETEAFADATRGTTLDTSADLYHNLLTLPVSDSMTDSDVHRVVEVLTSALETYR